ncbi:hypothetical protein B296_00025901 [Ensete ventricosum]|uniref:Uncharacterized protein n=1 Tax=Ensete ventricosum TaxID=4639 RepID=A0A426ZXQ4_ENSVE|nr:hypothetical protein B296_00025901 [Ensete ventricosum]
MKTMLVFFDAEWTLYEQVAFAAMDCQQYDVAKVKISLSLPQPIYLTDCIALLSKQFPRSIRIGENF